MSSRKPYRTCWLSIRHTWIVSLLAVIAVAPQVAAVDYSETLAAYDAGRYEESRDAAAEQVERGIWSERWPTLLIRCHLTLGEYESAMAEFDNALKRYPSSIALRWLGMDVLRRNGDEDRAAENEIRLINLLGQVTSRYVSRENLVAAGEFLESKNEDARKVLQLFYDRVLDRDPDFLPAHLATAKLALSKGDYQVAQETLQNAQKLAPASAEIDGLLARAWKTTNPEKSSAFLQAALEKNERHAPTLLQLAGRAIDSEDYAAAQDLIDRVLAVDDKHAEAYALSAVLAHLRGDYAGEKEQRERALATWKNNPHVDHVIGMWLSRKYRFREGAEYQRSALTMQPDLLPAQFQLAEDTLRLGHDKVGWQLAEEFTQADPYNVVAYNLMQLRDEMSGYRTLREGDLTLRMDAREASLFGDAALQLMREAAELFCERYEVDELGPVTAEIFRNQDDFAIRTFGLPGGAGYLGVCFGPVITMNSPSSQGPRPSNWQSVLWHEFAHAVTLRKTRNRMPRWLSEGISVYEERLRDPTWGQSMGIGYRQMIVDGGLTPISELSAAFLAPPSPMHLDFAYYQASLVVEFLVDQHGWETLRAILVDLGDGIGINDAITRQAGNVDRLNAEFMDHAKSLANQYAATLSFEPLDESIEVNKLALKETLELLESFPHHYRLLPRLAGLQMRQNDFIAAIQTLQTLRDAGLLTDEDGGTFAMLAQCYLETEQMDAYWKALRRWSDSSSNATDATLKLMQRALEESDPETATELGERYLAVNPLDPRAHRVIAWAAKERSQPTQALHSLRCLQVLDEPDKAGLMFQIAQAEFDAGLADAAKRSVLKTLEMAPRYRDAHRLLIQLVGKSKTDPTTTPEQAFKPEVASEVE
ncbi:MAG: tetratricopeptide repeat protein [Planctomycetota bacterium]